MRRRRASARAVEHDLPLPKRPFRDSAVMYGLLAVALVGVALLTGGGIVRALVVAGGFFLAATAWSWWRFRAKLAEERARQ